MKLNLLGVREPLMNRSLITSLVGLLVAIGLIQTDVGDNLTAFLVALAPVLAAVWGRQVVTPIADPRDNAGNPLTMTPANLTDEGGTP